MKSFLFLCLWAGCIVQLQAQSEPSVRIGHISDIKAQFEAKASEIKKGKYAQVKQNVPGMQPLELNLKVNKKEGAASLFYGEINNEENSNFYLRIEGEEVTGSIILRELKKYYRYSSTADGSIFLIEEDIDKILCVGYPQKPIDNHPPSGSSMRAAVAAVPDDLESLPGAEAVVFLDFDGHTVENTLWNSQFNDGNPIVAEPSTLTEAEMVEAWEMMSEDFRPFVLNVTTSEAVFNSAPSNLRMRVIFTPTNYFYPDAGGAAYLNSFTWGETSNGETPCFVWKTTNSSAGMTGAHEIGHTFNLYHDGRTSPSEEYYRGHDSWRPIMGTGSDKTMVQWSKGEYLNANNTEDDLAIIATNHGFTYRSDDHGDEVNNATPLIIEESGYVSADKNKGIITSRADVDVFSFSTNGEPVALMVEPNPVHPNLDIMLTLKNFSGSVVATADPPSLGASLYEALPAGTYYLFIDGVQGALGADSDYASLGGYTISTKDYCVPIYADGCNTYATLINNFSFNTLVNNSSACGNGTANGYTNYEPTGTFTTSVKRGQDYNLSMQSESSYAQYFGVWIDYNSDKDFDDEGELIYASSSRSTGQYSATITIPADAIVGTTRMRVRSNWDPMITSEQSCSAMTWGEAEDYTIAIIDNNTAPTVSISSPIEGANFTAPANITITANADDADGAIAKVEFFSGDLKLGEVLEAPYEYTWADVEEGNYSLTAVATDDQGLTTASAAVSVTVKKTFLTASVVLQGRPDKPDTRWSVPVRVSIYPAGQTEAVVNYESTTDENGNFAIDNVGLDAGDYVVTVKNAHTLNSARAVSLVAGENVVDFGELKEGDANDDNKVTILDFSILSGSFNLVAGTEGYDDRADFNEDEQVTILDFSLLSSNFNQSGYTVTDSSFIELNNRNARLAGMRTMLNLSPVYLELEKPKRMYRKGQEFTMPVLLHTGQQEIDGAEVHLEFDPEILQVTGIAAGEHLPVSLLDTYDNKAGKIDFAAGAFSSLPKGELVLFTVTFKAVGVSRKTPVTFTSGSPGETVVTYKGKSILGGVTSGVVATSDILGNKSIAAEDIKAYPNPTDGKFILSASKHVGKKGEVKVIGLNGTILKQFQVDLSADTNIQMNLSGQPTGMYLIILEIEGSTTVHRIQKL